MQKGSVSWYESAVEEMPAGYGDTLMSVSPVWAFPVVGNVAIILSILIANVFMRKQEAKIIKKHGNITCG